MKMTIYQVDAFTDHVFGGNPAAVCPLHRWIDESLMLSIAGENNLSETAFFVKTNAGFEIRWFTPELEIDLCGHATLATAHVLFQHLQYDRAEIEFVYAGGKLAVVREDQLIKMDFPAVPAAPTATTEGLLRSMKLAPLEAFKARDYMLIYDSEEDIASLTPDFAEMAKINTVGIIATAPGRDVDFVSRFFAPKAGINEDPVTGSAHCTLIPYWADRLGKSTLSALQLSKRRGDVQCAYLGERVMIAGQAVTYMQGEIYV